MYRIDTIFQWSEPPQTMEAAIFNNFLPIFSFLFVLPIIFALDIRPKHEVSLSVHN